jgi:hypothetical protein
MEAKNNLQNLVFFPKIKAGYKRPVQNEIYAQATFAFKLAVDVRAFLEDIDGALQHPHYLKTLKLRLLEMLYELNLVISYAGPMDELHFAALALEYGVPDIAQLDGPTLIDIFGLWDDFNSENVDISGVTDLFEQIIEEFPGEVPDPLVPSGQSVLLKALRNWDKICRTAQVNAKFIEDLLKEV